MVKVQEKLLKEFLEVAPGRNWCIFEQREIDYGIQVYVYRGPDGVKINFYTIGNIIIQGKKDSELKEELLQWREEREKEKVKQQKMLWDF